MRFKRIRSLLGIGLAMGACAAPALADGPAAGGPVAAVPWLHEGATLTVSWGVASHPGNGTDFSQDDNGNWMGADGQRLDASGRQASSASGVSEVSITCIDKGRVFADAHVFTDMRLFGFKDPLAQGEGTTFNMPAERNEMWVSPSLLAAMKSDPAAHTVVRNVQWKWGEKTVDAIRVSSAGANHLIDHVYERASGLCLHGAEAVSGAAPEMKYVAPGDVRAGDTLLTAFDLMSVRDVKTPWADEPLPDWCGQFKVLHYTGTSGMTRSWLAGAPTVLGLDVSRTDGGDGWLSVGTEGWAVIRGQRSASIKKTILNGRDQYDSFFAGPKALAALHQGQILDDDPATHVRTSVTQADGQAVTITSSSGGYFAAHTFDVQSGRLLNLTRTDLQTKITTTFKLEGQE